MINKEHVLINQVYFSRPIDQIQSQIKMIREKKEAIALTNKIEALKMKILKPRKIYSIRSQRQEQIKKNAHPIRDILFSELNLGNGNN